MVSKQSQQLMAAIRLRAVSERRYFGTALFALTLVERKGLGTMMIDKWGRVYVDTDIIGQGKAWTIEDAAVGLIHELGHWLRHHCPRAETLLQAEDLNLVPLLKNAMNCCQDAEINDDLEREGLKLLDSDMTPAKLAAACGVELKEGELFEVYWAAIRDKVRTNASETLQRLKDAVKTLRECGSGCHSVPLPHELGPPGPGCATPGIGSAEGDLLRKMVAQEIRAEASRNPGSVALGWQRWADSLLEPAVVPWEREFAALVRNAVTMARGMVDYSYTRPSRRVSLSGVVQPAMVRPDPDVGVVIDTSGSMTTEDLVACLRELQGILRSVGQRRCTVVCADADVQGVQTVSSAYDVDLKGGGGTDMGPGIERLRQLRSHVAVVLTDGYTPWPAEEPRGMQLVIGVICDDEDAGWKEFLPPWAKRVLTIPRAAATEAA